VPGLITREFFDTLTGEGSLGWNAYAVLALWGGVAVANVVAIFSGRHTKTQHRFGTSALVRRNVLSALLDRPGAEPLRTREGDPVSSGEVVSYLRDDGKQIEDLIEFYPELAGSGLFAVASFSVLLTVNWQVTVWVFIPLLLIVAVTQWAWHRIQTVRQAGRKATEKVTGFIGEMFGAVQAIQVADANERVLAYFDSINDLRRQTMVRDELLTALLRSIFNNIVALGIGLILLLLALNQSLSLSVGDFALFVYFLAFIGEFLAFFGIFIAFMRQSDVSFARLAALLPNRPARTVTAKQPLYLNSLTWKKRPRPPNEQPSKQAGDRLQTLAVQNLTYRFDETGRGVSGVSFSIKRGEILVITGRIGSGKTTLLRALQGLLPAQAGEIWWNDRPVADPAAFFTPPRSAYTPQSPNLFSRSLRENILLGLDQTQAAVDAAVKVAVFDQDLGALPSGYETLIGDRGTRLSGGQMQRTAVARMVVRRPELLIFDDVSSALDVLTEQALWERLFDTEGWDPTCIVVSHRPTVLRRADQIILLEDGQMTAYGKLDQLLKASEPLQEIWEGHTASD
ncbi:MAG: ABC transporter ATP-binding protein, partial [Chloroflexota bacterium]